MTLFDKNRPYRPRLELDRIRILGIGMGSREFSRHVRERNRYPPREGLILGIEKMVFWRDLLYHVDGSIEGLAIDDKRVHLAPIGERVHFVDHVYLQHVEIALDCGTECIANHSLVEL